LFANSDNDSIFPMDGNRRIIARLRQLYKMYDKPELVDDYVSKGGHDYRPDLRIAVFKWINKHLKNDTSDVKDADFKPLPGKELRVFPEDKDIPKDAINAKIDETFVPKASVSLPKAGEFDAWRKRLLKELRVKSFRGFPTDIPALQVKNDSVAGFTSESGIEVKFLIDEKGTHESEVLVVLDRGRVEQLEKAVEASGIPEGKQPWYFIPRGGWGTEWTRKNPPNYVERAHALLGRTVDEGRVWDIIAAVKYLQKNKKAPRRVIGAGHLGILAAYAALFEPSIPEVVIVDPPVSHREGPIFLNVLRVLDIPEALGLLAPRRLTLINAKDKAFDRTVEIYRLAGATDRLQRK